MILPAVPTPRRAFRTRVTAIAPLRSVGAHPPPEPSRSAAPCVVTNGVEPAGTRIAMDALRRNRPRLAEVLHGTA
jgi:hypothetical protein